MSTCISMDGEYSEHVYDGETLGSKFTCARCFVHDEGAANAEVKRLTEALAVAEAALVAERAKVAEALNLANNWHKVGSDRGDRRLMLGMHAVRSVLRGGWYAEGPAGQPRPDPAAALRPPFTTSDGAPLTSGPAR